MSDSYLRYVPTIPTFQTQKSSAKAAEGLLGSYFPNADSIAAGFLENVEFIDAGSNWSGVHCPLCGADVEDWWSEVMATAAEARFEDLKVSAPCCKGSTSLNLLRYVWPVAFGRFVLEAENPNSKGLTPRQLRALEEVLGCKLQEVATHV